ncbi:MAG: cyclophilin-like fold protein [Clostridia bacterium]|jgi:hypothetical protein|nr:cyclophilin-like fold protein [Clostridia bacterium]MDH7572533.1 cyclophilin-like fold protein [Clostridia bacterium]
MRAVLRAGGAEVEIEFNAGATAVKIWKALPLQAEAQTWGDEVYFTIPVEAELEDPRELVEMGDVGYWPPGRALCLFFGPTPVSRPGEIRPYSPVTVVGRVLGDPQALKAVRSGDRVRVWPREGEAR